MAIIRARTDFGPSAASFDNIRQSVALSRPTSIRQMAGLYARDLIFDEPLITASGIALGGHQTLVIRRNGSYEFSGHFRATGFPSFDVSLVSTVAYKVPNPVSPTPAAAAFTFVANGRVHGTVEPGDREFRWNQQGELPIAKGQWHAVRQGVFGRNLQFDTDWFGPAGNVIGFLAQVVAFGATLGAAGVAIVLAGEAADLLDLEQLVLPGVVGVIVAGGVGYIFGPVGMFPAFVLGAAVTAATVKQRHLRDSERAFADRVFRGKVPFDRVLLTNLLGIGNRAFTAPGPGGAILVNIGTAFDDPVLHTGHGGQELGGNAPGQLLIHELTHAWQIANESFTPEFYCRAVSTAGGTTGGDMSAYSYGAPTGSWSSFGTEQQGSIVDEWFAGKLSPNPGSSPQGKYLPMQIDDVHPGPNPYFRYVRDNIWTGIAS